MAETSKRVCKKCEYELEEEDVSCPMCGEDYDK